MRPLLVDVPSPVIIKSLFESVMFPLLDIDILYVPAVLKNIYPYVMNKNEDIDIDTIEDWKKAEL